MPVTQQAPQKERVFGTDGTTIEESEITQEEENAEEPEAPAVDPDENQDPDPDLVSEAATAPQAPAHKYRIGDKTFATQAEALTYAESQVAPASEVDAYRQVLREAISAVPRKESAAPPAQSDDLNAEEIYTDPTNFLKRYGERIKTETLQQVQQSQASVEADNRIWREFTDRHPDLLDFREEITALVGRIQPEVQAVGRTKGSTAAYDYVATKFKAQVERINAALKPKRELRSGGTGAPAGAKVETVTPKTPTKKPLSFAEQLRQIRRRGAK